MRKHVLKSWLAFFQPIFDGTRTHELRLNDRDFKVGDVCELREFDEDAQTFTGRHCNVLITSMTSKELPCAVSEAGLHKDFCILSIRLIT